MEINKNERIDREAILGLVSEYTNKYHVESEYVEGQQIKYAGRVFDKNEVVTLVSSALDFWLTGGKYTEQFEEELSNFLRVKHCTFVNSGSSANLLAFMALTSPLLKERAIRRGDEVITVAAGFPTTVSPIVQYGAVPVFVDIDIPSYNIDCSLLESALSEKTKAVMIAHTLGNPFAIEKVKSFCERNNLWLIEDNCDALGTRYKYKDKMCFTGTIGDIGTSSFYPAHHITTGEGGAVYTNNAILHKIVKSMRDWGRDCTCISGQDNLCGNRFERTYGKMPKGYDHKYIYSHFGYNLKATDMQAAIGVEQLRKIEFFNEERAKNHKMLFQSLRNLECELILPKGDQDVEVSWFGFMITCKIEGIRDRLVKYLEENGVQTRMLFAGNLTRQPCFDYFGEEKGYRIIGKLEKTDYVMNNSFWLGVYPGMTTKKINYIAAKIIEFYR